MCGRMTITTKGYEQLAELLEAEPAPELATEYRPRYNVAPTDAHPIVTVDESKRLLAPARWGITRKGAPLFINARAETASRLAIFRNAFAHGRCLVPADGFYEWKGPKKDRRPVWFHPPEKGIFVMAGIFEEHGPQRHFAVLTKPADDLVQAIHDRMPVILSPELARKWLEIEDPSEARELCLLPRTVAMTGTDVSRRVNSVKNDDPGCLEPDAPQAPSNSQGELF